MPDALETVGKDVEEKAIEKGVSIDGQDSFPISMGGVAPAESDHGPVEAEDPVIGQGHAVGVAREVVQDSLRPGRWCFGVHDPLVLAQRSFERLDCDAVELMGLPCSLRMQHLEVLASKDARKSADRKQEAAWRLDPATSRGIEPAGGHDAMQVDV